MIVDRPQSDNISVAETTRHSWETEEARLARKHDIQIREMELAYMKQEQHAGTLFKLPLTIIKLPVYIILAIGFCLAMLNKHNPEQNFWDLLK